MSTKIKVVHITTVHHPFDPRIYHKECQSLSKAGFDVSLIVSDHEDLKNHFDKDVKIIPIKKSSNRFIRIIKSSYDAYRVAKKLNAKIYHFHDPELLFVGWMLKNNNNIVIYDVHEDYETSIQQKVYLNKFVAKITASLFRLIERKLSKSFEVCLAEKYYSEKFPEGQTILNYPLVSNVNNIESDLATINKNENYDLIYTGNITKDRGALIHATLPNIDEKFNVSLIGKCSRNLANEMYAIVGERENQLSIDGVDKYIPREEIDKKYQEKKWLAGLAIFPPTDHYLKKELTKFFEYMNVGMPIICSNFPVWKKFIEENECGIAVDPSNEEEIKNAVYYLANNPAIAKNMGEKGRMAVQNKLNWTNEAEKLVDWYKMLLK